MAYAASPFDGDAQRWYTAPMPVFTFLEQYDQKDKTVIPFCTAYSGPSSTLRDIEAATPNSTHAEGLCIVTKEQGGQGMDVKHDRIDKWLTKIVFQAQITQQRAGIRGQDNWQGFPPLRKN